jgi:acetoin utilization deacetylase AcuC-like enzyme
VMRCAYSPLYSPPLGKEHPFPMGKYAAVHERLIVEGTVLPSEVQEPRPAHIRDLARVHCAEYLQRFLEGRLSPVEERRLGFPWSPALARRASRATAGTLMATRWALEDGIGANLAGGSHHAFHDRGEGYCAINDIAVAAGVLRAEGFDGGIAVVDLDVHQGNGTAALLGRDPQVYTLSLHGECNYPRIKVPGTRDVGLPPGAGDEEYLRRLDEELDRLWSRLPPEIVFYQAGVDGYADDRLGSLSLTPEGLWARSEQVFRRCRAARVPVVVLMGGGYARRFEDTVELHADVYRCARRWYGGAADSTVTAASPQEATPSLRRWSSDRATRSWVSASESDSPSMPSSSNVNGP